MLLAFGGVAVLLAAFVKGSIGFGFPYAGHAAAEPRHRRAHRGGAPHRPQHRDGRPPVRAPRRLRRGGAALRRPPRGRRGGNLGGDVAAGGPLAARGHRPAGRGDPALRGVERAGRRPAGGARLGARGVAPGRLRGRRDRRRDQRAGHAAGDVLQRARAPQARVRGRRRLHLRASTRWCSSAR